MRRKRRSVRQLRGRLRLMLGPLRKLQREVESELQVRK